MQALLLRFLENGEIQAVGADRIKSTVDVRVVAATNRNLRRMVASGQFREDLLYRLRVIHVDVPPLRERREDIRVLVAAPRVEGGALGRASPTRRCARSSAIAGRATSASSRTSSSRRSGWPSGTRRRSDAPAAGRAGVGRRRCCPSRSAASRCPTSCTTRSSPAASRSGSTFTRCSSKRDITRHDMRELVRRGLATTRGNYRSLLRLFGMPASDYKRFLNFLAAHDCNVDFRAYRSGTAPTGPLRPRACFRRSAAAAASQQVRTA